MVQAALDMLNEALLRFELSLPAFMAALTPVAGLAGIVVLALVALGIWDRERLRARLAALPALARQTALWLVVALSVAAGVYVLQVVRLATDVRFAATENAQSARGADPDAASMVQDAPKAAYFAQKTYRRILTLPPELLGRISEDGVEALAPYLTDPSAQSVVRLADSFRRSGRQVVFQRDQTLETEQPIKLDSSTVDATVELVDPAYGGRRTFFRAAFDGRYVFHNPLGTPAHVRFTFPLPTGSGTLSDVTFTVGGAPVTVTDLSDGYVWDGELPANGTTTAEIAYRNQGARGWAYRLSGRREPLAKLDLTVHANRAPKFARYSIFPTASSHGFAGGDTLEWHLANVVTAQDIGLVFARLDVRELLAKLLTYAPVALFVALLFVAVYALRRGLRVPPLNAAVAVVGFTLGLALAGIFTWYVPLALGVVLGCAVAVVLAIRALGRPFALPLTLATFTMVAFLFVTNTSLVLVADCTAALWTLVPLPGLSFLRRT